MGALGSGQNRVRGMQQSGRGGTQRKGVDEGSEFSDVFELCDEESDYNSDGDDDVLPGLSAFSNQLKNASGPSEANTAEYTLACQG